MKPLITMIVPVYNQPTMLAKQLETWAKYSPECKSVFTFIVVDDCSKFHVENEVRDARHNQQVPVSLYRIDEDVPWNRGMARNLGTHVATTPWVLHVDTDHVLPPESAKMLAQPGFLLQAAGRQIKTWFRFDRFRVGAADETRKKDKVHPNATMVRIHEHIDSYICTPQDYWKAGGYNEDFSGVLGGGSPFLKEMERVNGAPGFLLTPLHVYTRHAVPDSSEHTLPRDPEAFTRRKKEIMKARGTLRGHDPLRLPYHKVF